MANNDIHVDLAAKQGQLTRDPYGEPVPQRDGRMEPQHDIPLVELEPGVHAFITRVPDRDPILLQYLGDAGMIPGATLHVTVIDRLAGVVTVLPANCGSHAIGETLATRIRVATGRHGIPSPRAVGTS